MHLDETVNLAPFPSGNIGVRIDNDLFGDIKPDADRPRYSAWSGHLFPNVYCLRKVSHATSRAVALVYPLTYKLHSTNQVL